MDTLEQTGEEVIKQAVDRIDNARDEIYRIARAMNDLGMSSGGDLLIAWQEIVGPSRLANAGNPQGDHECLTPR